MNPLLLCTDGLPFSGGARLNYLQKSSSVIYLLFFSVCTSSSFSCEDTGVCIPQSFVCDGDYDCLDHSDEQYCCKFSSLIWFLHV